MVSESAEAVHALKPCSEYFRPGLKAKRVRAPQSVHAPGRGSQLVPRHPQYGGRQQEVQRSTCASREMETRTVSPSLHSAEECTSYKQLTLQIVTRATRVGIQSFQSGREGSAGANFQGLASLVKN